MVEPEMRVYEVITGGRKDLTDKCIEVDVEAGWAMCMERIGEDFAPIRRNGQFVVEEETKEAAHGN